MRRITGRTRMPRQEREEQMLNAAEAVFGERGFRGASMDEIAERSGVTKPLVYQYFGSKDDMYEACIERVRSRFVEEVELAAAGVPPAEALRIFTRRFFAHVAEHRGSWWLLYGEASDAAVHSMRQRNAEFLIVLLERVFAQAGALRDAALIELLANVLVGAGEQAGRWWAERPDLPREEVVEQFMAVSEAGVLRALELAGVRA